MYSVRIVETGWEFEADEELTVLEAAAFAGISMPSSCQSGACRTCISKLCKGKVAYRNVKPNLTLREKWAGMILPCVAHPVSDLLIESPAAESLPD